MKKEEENVRKEENEGNFSDDEGGEGEEAMNEEDDAVPRDRGYAWIILLSATLEMTLLIGILKSAGVLFVAFQDRFESSSSMTSLLSTVQNICFSVMALFVTTVGMRLASCRTLMFIGCIIVATAYVITSQATDIRLLLVSHGILHGIGSAFMQPTTLTMISLYFNKRRGFANSMAVSGGSLGGLIFAPLISGLLTAYGYQGCFLIIAGLLLNSCISAALFRPTSFYTRKKKVDRTENEEVEKTSLLQDKHNNDKISSNSDLAKNNKYKNISTTENSVSQENLRIVNSRKHLLTDKLNKEVLKPSNVPNATDMIRDRSCSASAYYTSRDCKGDQIHDVILEGKVLHLTISDVTATRRHRTLTETSFSKVVNKLSTSKTSLYARSEFITGSVMELPVTVNDLKHGEITSENPSQFNIATKTKGCLVMCANIFDFKLLKVPIFLAFMLSAGFICSSTVTAQLFIAPCARDIGVAVDDIAALVIIFSAVDLCSRIFVGLIADRGWLRRSTLAAIATTVVGFSAHLVRFYTNYYTLLVFAVVLGLVSGVYFSLYSVVIVDYMSIEKLHSCIGFTALVHGFSVAGAFYLIGYLRDVTGSYVIPYHLIGSLSFLGAGIMFLLPAVERLQNRKSMTPDSC